MFRIVGLSKSTGAKERRKFFECPQCKSKNWFTEGTPYICQNPHCDKVYDRIRGLLDNMQAARVFYYRKGKV